MSGMPGEQLAGRRRLHIPVAAGVKFSKGDFAVINASGYAEKPDKKTGLINAGVAMNDVDNTSGSDGAVYVETERGTYIYGNSGDVKETDLLKECYFAGADSVSTAGKTTSSVAGTVVYADESTVAVDML